jgi:uncharacterized protein YcfL
MTKLTLSFALVSLLALAACSTDAEVQEPAKQSHAHVFTNTAFNESAAKANLSIAKFTLVNDP